MKMWCGRRIQLWLSECVLLLVAVQFLQNSSCSKQGVELLEEANRILFPEKDYKSYHDNIGGFVNPEWFFKMNNCTPLYSESKDVLLISGSICNELPVKRFPTTEIRTKISIKWTPLKTIRKNAFSSWTKIYTLRISENANLEKLEGGAFNGMTDLHTLIITDNYKLSMLDEETFINLINLKDLSLARNTFFEIAHIANSLSKASVPLLDKLDISGNPIGSIDSNFFSNMSEGTVTELVLKDMSFEQINEGVFHNFKNLTKITLGQTYPTQNFINLLEGLNRYQLLSEVVLHNLDATETKEVLYKTITDSHYTKLRIKGSVIGEIQDSDDILDMNRALTLEEIELTDSNIEDFPIILFNSNIFPMLNKIILKSDQFSYIPNDIPTSPVKLLDLSGNKLRTLQKNAMYFAPQLEVLILTDTGLETLPENAFSSNNNLVILVINRNDFQQSSFLFTKDIFAGLKSLKVLDISSCKIIDFRNKDVFEHLESVQTVSLKSNHIRHIDAALFKPMRQLQKLDLRNNLMLVFNPSFFQVNPTLTDIGLFTELFKVDEKLINWLKFFRVIENELKDLKQCANIQIETQNDESNQTTDTCRIVVMHNQDNSEDYGSYDMQTDDNANNNFNYTEVEEIDYVYILFRPNEVYKSLSGSNVWSILRFVYVFLFYLIIFLIITYALIKLVNCITKWRRRRRPCLIFDEKTDYCGIENKGFNIPYEKMKDVKLGLNSDKS